MSMSEIESRLTCLDENSSKCHDDKEAAQAATIHCTYCNKDNHTEDECWKKKKDAIALCSEGPDTECNSCGGKGHYASD